MFKRTNRKTKNLTRNGRPLKSLYRNGRLVYTNTWEGLTFEALEANSTVAYHNNGSNSPDVKYRKPGSAWTQWSPDSPVTLALGEKLYVKGNNANGFNTSESNRTAFSGTGRLNLSGNCNSLLDNDDGSTVDTIPCNYCFVSLFSNNNAIYSALNFRLPATNLKASCYQYLFLNCNNLIDVYANLLPATNIPDSVEEWHGTYAGMFRGCISLVYPPNLPATNLGTWCYYAMLYGCTSLATAPRLNATVLKERCYGDMFGGCTSLRVRVSSGTKIFTCPSTSGLVNPVTGMFLNTGGTFTGTPTAGTTYYYY